MSGFYLRTVTIVSSLMGGCGLDRGGGANSMAVSGLSFRNTLVGTRLSISLILCTNRLRKQFSPVGLSYLTVNVFPEWWLFIKSCDYCKLIKGV